MTRPGWSVVAPGRRGKGATLRHDSGWQVQHCGHPTATHPYCLLSPDGALTFSHNGMGFSRSSVAVAGVEALAAGELVATTERCVAGIQRIDNVTAGGDRLSPAQIADLEWHAAERARRTRRGRP